MYSVRCTVYSVQCTVYSVHVISLALNIKSGLFNSQRYPFILDNDKWNILIFLAKNLLFYNVALLWGFIQQKNLRKWSDFETCKHKISKIYSPLSLGQFLEGCHCKSYTSTLLFGGSLEIMCTVPLMIKHLFLEGRENNDWANDGSVKTIYKHMLPRLRKSAGF